MQTETKVGVALIFWVCANISSVILGFIYSAIFHGFVVGSVTTFIVLVYGVNRSLHNAVENVPDPDEIYDQISDDE